MLSYAELKSNLSLHVAHNRFMSVIGTKGNLVACLEGILDEYKPPWAQRSLRFPFQKQPHESCQQGVADDFRLISRNSAADRRLDPLLFVA